MASKTASPRKASPSPKQESPSPKNVGLIPKKSSMSLRSKDKSGKKKSNSKVKFSDTPAQEGDQNDRDKSGKRSKSKSPTKDKKKPDNMAEEEKAQEKEWKKMEEQDNREQEEERAKFRRSRLGCYNNKLGPGPGDKMLPPLVGFINHDGTRSRAPAYTLGLGRTEQNNKLIWASAKYAAGPGSYNLAGKICKIKTCYSPAYSLGLKHTKCEGTFFQDPREKPCCYFDKCACNRKMYNCACIPYNYM